MTQLITLYFALPAIFMTAVTGTRRYLPEMSSDVVQAFRKLIARGELVSGNTPPDIPVLRQAKAECAKLQ